MEYWETWFEQNPSATDAQVIDAALEYVGHPQVSPQGNNCMDQLTRVLARVGKQIQVPSSSCQTKSKRKASSSQSSPLQSKQPKTQDIPELVAQLRQSCTTTTLSTTSAAGNDITNLDDMMAAARSELSDCGSTRLMLPAIRVRLKQLTLLEHLIRGWYLDVAHRIKGQSYKDAAHALGCTAKNPTSSDPIRRAKQLYALVVDAKLYRLRYLQDPKLIGQLLQHREKVADHIHATQKDWWSQDPPTLVRCGEQASYIPYIWLLK